MIAAAAVTAAVAVPQTAFAADSDPQGPSLGSVTPTTVDAPASKVPDSLRARTGQVTVMVELDQAPAAVEYSAALPDGKGAAQAAAKQAGAKVEAQASKVQAALGKAATKGQVLYSVKTLYSGVAIRTDASKLDAIAALDGVKAIHAINPLKLQNAATQPLIEAPEAWSAAAGTGKGIKVGIIDTGIDYTHADFGGPGTVEAYQKAHADSTGPWTPTAKVVGGYDFVGDSYNADPTDPKTYQPVPHPDQNPLDCQGHGTHVAGTVGGYGVTKDGKTYTGSYTKSTDFGQFAAPGIGPGVAPDVQLYALRVFGCGGSTDVVTQALDWAADPNGDGNFSDHLDVVNMSLGSDYGVADSPDSVAANNAALAGVTVVASAGNSGDITDLGSSPADAVRAISVAASDDTQTVASGLRVTEPASAAGLLAGQYSVDYDWVGEGGLTTPTSVATLGAFPSTPTAQPADNVDGCDPYTPEQAAKVKGKVALLYWTDDDSQRGCGSVARGANARAAGAVGAIFSDDAGNFGAGITGDSVIPIMQVTDAGTKVLLDNLATVKVQMLYSDRNTMTITTPETKDTMMSFSSRGERTAGNMKPDVTAPGGSIFSSANGTGNEGESLSGTSMAAPHVTGVAALVKAAHPTWTVEQVKAAITGTASTPVKDADGNTYGPTRAGTGRVDAYGASQASVLAYSKGDDGAVSVGFGPVQAVTNVVKSKPVTVQNTGSRTVALDLSYSPINAVPGVTYTVSPSRVSVKPGKSTTVLVTMKVTAKKLAEAFDKTQVPTAGGVSADLVSEATGLVLVKQSGHEVSRVAVGSTVRPASLMTGFAFGSGKSTTARLQLLGKSVDQGATYLSTVTALQLAAKDPKQASCTADTADGNCVPFASQRPADVRYVAVGSTVPGAGWKDGLVDFGLTSWAPADNVAGVAEFDVMIDTNQDGKADFVAYNTHLNGTDNLLVAYLVNLSTNKVVDAQLINNADGSLDTGKFDATSLVMPVSAAALGLSDSSSAFDYWVESYGLGSGLQIGSVGSPSAPLTFDAAKPAYQVSSRGVSPDTSLQFLDKTGHLTVIKDKASIKAQDAKGLWLLHHLNVGALQAQVVPVP